MVVVHEADKKLMATPEHTIDCAASAGKMVNPRSCRLVSNNEPALYLTVEGWGSSALNVKQYRLLYTAGDVGGIRLSLMGEGAYEEPGRLAIGMHCQSFEPCGRGRFVLTWEDAKRGLHLSVTPRGNREFSWKGDGHINYTLDPVPLEEGPGIDPQHVDFLPEVLDDSCCHSGRIIRCRSKRGEGPGRIELYQLI